MRWKLSKSGASRTFFIPNHESYSRHSHCRRLFCRTYGNIGNSIARQRQRHIFYRQPQGSVATGSLCLHRGSHFRSNIYLSAGNGSGKRSCVSANGSGLYCRLYSYSRCTCANVLQAQPCVNLRLSRTTFRHQKLP